MATVLTAETVTSTTPNLLGDFMSNARNFANTLSTQAQAALGDTNAMAELASDMTLPEFLNTIDTFQPDYAGVTEVLRSNPQLGVAFQDAFVNNEDFRSRLMDAPEGSDNLLSAENIETILTNEQYGGQAQMLMTRMLDKVASGEMSIEQVEQVAGAGVNMMAVMDNEESTAEQKAEAQDGFFQTLEQNGLPTGQIKGEHIMSYLSQVMNGDPAGASANLVNALGLSGEQAAAIQELLTMAGGFMQFLGQPYVEFFNRHAPGISSGATNLFERVTGQRDTEIAEAQATLTPAQRAQNALSEQANQPGAMQDNATVHGEGLEGVEQRVDTTMELNSAANDDTPETVDPALAGQHFNQTRMMGMGLGQ